jgi:hypothetical protein
MGAGILPTTIHNNKLYFLFGKENKYADTPGWSDIGGGTDNNETFLQTAAREGAEELTGFLGMENDIKKLLARYGTYNIDWGSLSGKTYRMHIFPMAFDPMLPVYYNNNHRFIEHKLPADMVQNSKIFEKDELRWVCVDDIPKMRKKFRVYFQPTADMILDQRAKIDAFIRGALGVKKSTKKKTRRRHNRLD